MKAIIHSQYGPASLLQIREVDKPVPRDDEVLIAIQATTVSTGDCNMRNFTFVTRSMVPLARLMFGIRKPWKPRVLGTQFAGQVEETGKNVKRFKRGDKVVVSTGMAGGGHAQYACVSEQSAIALKPDTLNWEEAVAIPFGANTALYFLQYLARIKAGQTILIIGASGSIGSAAVQLARHFGATVTAVCSGRNAELVKSLGADTVIDYTREDFTRRSERYDVIFDVVGATSFRQCRHVLTSRGVFLQNIVGLTDVPRILWTAIAGGRKLKAGVAVESRERMALIMELASKSKLKPIIDRSYPLENVAQAFTYVEQGHKTGNVVVTTLNPMIS